MWHKSARAAGAWAAAFRAGERRPAVSGLHGNASSTAGRSTNRMAPRAHVHLHLRGAGLGRDQGSKSKRTAPSTTFSRASNRFPAFDVNPLRSGLLPLRRRAWAVRALIFLPAIVFQTANLQPARQPLQ